MYVHTHTNTLQTYILGRWGENFQQAGKDFQGEKKSWSSQRHFTYFSLRQYLTAMSLLFLLQKAELILLLSCWPICHKETVSLLKSAAGKVQKLISCRWVSWACVCMAYGWKALTGHWHKWQMPKCRKTSMCVYANVVSMPEKNAHRSVRNRAGYIHSC